MSRSAGAHVHASLHHSKEFGCLRPTGNCPGHAVHPTLGTQLAGYQPAGTNFSERKQALPR
eukprot:4458038-Heterocapsa_arctica.AAC.1